MMMQQCKRVFQRPLVPQFYQASLAMRSMQAPTTQFRPFTSYHNMPLFQQVETIKNEQESTSMAVDAEKAEKSVMPPPTIFAVVQVGGHQYKVTEGEHIIVDQIPIEVGTEIILNKVLLVGGQTFTAIGTPLVSQAVVNAVVEEQTRSGRQIIFKKKRRKSYKRFKTHSQPVTVLKISKITFATPSSLPNERVVAIE